MIFFIIGFTLLSLSKCNFLISLGINTIILPLYMIIFINLFYYEKQKTHWGLDLLFLKNYKNIDPSIIVESILLYVLCSLFGMISAGIISYLITFESTSVIAYIIGSIVINIIMVIIKYLQDELI